MEKPWPRTLLFTGQEGRFVGERRTEQGLTHWDYAAREPKLRAYDKGTGELVAEIDMPVNAGGAPMTYLAGGKQFIVMAVGGANLAAAELIALALP